MAQKNATQMKGGKGNNYQFIDTTYYTKIFVGGLAWETRREDMKQYFEKFGAIEEAVVITDKITGRSKGYGFVTFKDPNAAMKACQDPFPVIDGRRTNCNLACLGAQRTRPTTPQYGNNKGSFRGPTPPPPPPPLSMATPTHQGSSMAYFHQLAYNAFPYLTYDRSSAGCSSEDNMFPMIYPYAHGGQQYSNFQNMEVTSSMPRTYPNSYALHAQYAQIGQVQGFEMKYPSMLQYSSYIPQQYYGTSMFLSSAPSSATSTITTSTGVNMGATANVVARTSTPGPGTISNQDSPT